MASSGLDAGEQPTASAAVAAAGALRVILGLGNPGSRYRGTRHNVGFQVLDELARRAGATFDQQVCKTKIAELGELILAAPQTFMNRSGYAARCLLERLALEPAQILVVYDEVHLPLGRLRLRVQGSPGGHRGLESIVESLSSERVPRLRLGVGGEQGAPAGEDLVEYVLAPFAAEQRETVAAMIVRAADACRTWAEQGAEAAMREFNG